MSAIQILWWAAAVLAVAASLRWGAAPERRGAVMLFAGYLLTLALSGWVVVDLRIGTAAVDAAFALGLVWLAATTRRWWVLVALANQLLILFAHASTVMDGAVMARADVTTRWVFGVIVLLAVAIGPLEARWAGEGRGFGRRISPGGA